MPSVSIIVPSLNQGAFIGQTVHSILGQDFGELECVVMDGGSTDDTLDILRSINDPRLTWVSEPDRGQSDAINKGLQRASGQFLSYLNSDDVLLPGAVSSAVAAFDRLPEADLIAGDLLFINESGQEIDMLPGQPFILAELLGGKNRFNQAGAFWRRRLTERIGLFDESLHYCMDHDYWARASLSGAVIEYVPGARAAFRFHASSKTVSQTEGFLADWDRLLTRLEREHAADPAFVRMIDECRTASAWRNAAHFWREGKLTSVRPQLRRVITRHPSPARRAFSALLLFDSYTGTQTARLALAAANALTGGKRA